MRYSVLAIAPFVAAALAQSESSSTSTYTYSNTMTNFLTETNSLGVVTGMPTAAGGGVVFTSQPTQPAVVTSQPALATIPAGLPAGIATIYLGGNNMSASSFLVSVGSSTTAVLASSVTIVSGSVVSSEPTSASGASGSGASGTGSAAPSSSTGAAASLKLASGAVIGIGAFFAALL